MGEAERSIAIKRQIVAPRSTDREDSPSEVYTPKRKKSSGGLEPSPPPYIPSRKEGSSVGLRASSSSSSSHREVDHRRGGHHADSRSEHARQTLSSQDRRDLISRSRRMELFKHIGIDRKEEPVSHGNGSHSRNVRQSPRKTDSRKVEDSNQRRGNSSSLSSIRQVSGRRRDNENDDGVKDLKIKARLGPVVRTTLSESRKSLETEDSSGEGGFDLRKKMTRSSNSKDDTIQIIVNSSIPPALKGSIASRLGKIVVKRDELEVEGLQGNSHIKGETVGKGRMAISTHAKSLVNKQCREAVLSVSASGRKLRKSVSPDSRCFEDADDDDEEEEEEEDEADEEEEDAGNKKEENTRIGRITEGKSVSITVKQTVMKEESKKDKNKEVDDDDRNDNNTSQKVVEDEEGEPEDLAEMIGEKLEPELLNDTVQDELNLDAEVNAEDADDIETMIGVKSEADKPKPGTRFIVTLDGVDERQLYSDSSGNDGKSMELPPYIRPPQTMVVDPSKKLSPSIATYAPQLTLLPPLPPSAQQMVPSVGIPVQSNIGQSTTISPGALPHTPFPPVQFNLGEPHPLPPISSGIIRDEPQINKPLPPKIQPFSINLKDSDDEFEDKESRMQISPSTSGGYINNASLTSLTALQKAKMSERCKFWPACAAGSECEFHHPTSYCKTFPNCKFADKCLFIHPNCKFDSKCTRQDCPFTHISRRPGLSSLSSSAPSSVPTIPFHPPKAPAPVPSRTATVCRFFPNCHNPTCLFLHPKPCRFGAACQNPSCPFYHPAPAVIVPTKDKLTWKAQTVTTHVKDITPTSSSSSLSLADPAAKFRQPVAKVSPMNSTNS